MDARALVLVALLSSGCGYGSSYAKEEAIFETIFAVTAVAANAVQEQVSRAQQDRKTSPGLVRALEPRGETKCGTRAYRLYCSSDDRSCVYRTQYGFEYACSTRNCDKGPPPALLAWCKEE